jgi:hypothetical protein
VQREAPDHAGECPEIGLKGVTVRQYPGGASREPDFIINRWVPRPDEFGAAAEPPQPQQPRKQPARAGDDIADEISF